MLYTAAQIVFWTSAGLLLYVYAGYPLLVYLVSLISPKVVKRGEFEPKVTVLITAYNEEKDIARKLENTFEIDYPGDKLEILVASDGSTDRTDEIVRGFEDRDVRLFRQDGRLGKTYTQNKAVELAAGEIILFSDATTAYRPDVLREMLPNFADESVGCVAGKLVYVDDSSSNVGKGARSYWNYETSLKQAESRACSLIGASGCLYAVRRSAYQPMYPEACSDFLICTVLYRQGLRSVYEPNAICEEETNQRADKEMSMRVRVILQTYTDLWRNRDMLNPFKGGFYAIELFSHKVLRYAVLMFLILAFATSVLLAENSAFYTAAFAFQALFYLLALAGWGLEKVGLRLTFLVIPLYFVMANLACAVAFFKFLRGERFAKWEPIRDPH